MKGFYIDVSNELLTPEHCKNMGDSLWLYLLFLDKITVIKGGRGKVLGGKPMLFSDVENALGISRKLYIKWINILRKGDYISTTRTPYGLSIFVNKAKKRFNRTTNSCENVNKIDISDVTKREHLITCTQTGTSEMLPNGNIDVPKREHLKAPDVTKREHLIRQNQNLDSNNDKNSLQSTPSGIDCAPLENGKFSDHLKNTMANGIPENEITEKMVSEAIGFFLPLLPIFFTTKNPFAMKPTRSIVRKTLMVKNMDGLKSVIEKYNKSKNEKYIPTVKTIYEFCSKLDAIETFLKKPTGNTYAQKSISSDEHKEKRDARLREMAEERKQRSEQFKQEFEKEQLINK